MRRPQALHGAAMGGQVSRQAMSRRGWDFGTTSDNPRPLTRDDGGVCPSGSIRADHAVESRAQPSPPWRGLRQPGARLWTARSESAALTTSTLGESRDGDPRLKRCVKIPRFTLANPTFSASFDWTCPGLVDS